MQNSSLKIEFDGQSMTHGDYIYQNYTCLRDHFYNHFCLNYTNQTRRYVGLFLQKFLNEVRLHGVMSTEDVLKFKLKKDVYKTFVQSKFQKYITFKNKKAEETLPSITGPLNGPGPVCCTSRAALCALGGCARARPEGESLSGCAKMRAPRRRTLRKGGRRAEAPFQGASAALSMATLAGAACVGRHELPCRHTARESVPSRVAPSQVQV